MKKILIIILITVISCVSAVFFCDAALYIVYKTFKLKGFEGQKFGYAVKNANLLLPDFSNIPPDGIEYSSAPPVTVFGCSYAWGQHLERSQTFTYKLAQILKRPVYNRASIGGGLQFMYNQSISPDFYNQVKKSDTVIYVFIDDHYRRMTGETFQLFDDYSYLHYKVRGNELIQDNYSSYMLNLLRSSYTLRLLRSKIKNAYIDNPKNAAKITDDALLYLVKTRENLQNHWNNKIKFYVVLYGRVKYSDILRKKLKDNGFIIIDSSSITKADLFSAKYLMKDNGHPKESAWDILTPGIAEKIESSGETK